MVVAVSLLAVSAFVLSAYALARRNIVSPTTVRKALHVAVGAWTLLVTPYFHSLGWALVLPGLFLIVNASPQARPLFRAIEGTGGGAKGLWTFPAGVVLAYVIFWEDRPAVLAGLAALAFADPAAAIVGKRFGQRHFRWFGHGRTLEGSLAFLLVAGVGAAMAAACAAHATGTIPWRAGVGCGLVGAAVEAVTPSGWDNLTIPVAVAWAYQTLV